MSIPALLSIRSLSLLGLFGALSLIGCDSEKADEAEPEPEIEDADGDGVVDADDCDPFNAEVYPGAAELEDWLDNDCDDETDEGTGRADDDGDGFSDYEGDCDDARDDIFPGAPEVAYDGLDQDCDGADLVDVDGDGYIGVAGGGDDCDDDNAAIFPGADEWANGVDDNCNNSIDEATDVVDDDGDGYAESEGDCDDDDAAINPDAVEIAYDGVDQDCDLQDMRDLDEDGYDGELAGGTDCDDEDGAVYPGADEIAYDDIDQDCDGVDLIDVDGDGFLPIDGDCDDEEDTVYPGSEEVADRLDNDCDGTVDEATVYADDDGDGYAEIEGDCDDDDGDRYPNAYEELDGIDNDCNDLIDERNLDGAVEITGRSSSDYFGQTIDVGDFNGDGVQDLAVGARYDDGSSYYAGQAWVISGDTAGGTVEASAEMSVVGTQSYSYLGSITEFIPDMDGDGYDELMVTAPYEYSSTSYYYEGFAYLIPGAPSGTYSVGELPADIASDVIRGGQSYTYSPDDVAGGDLNGDGFGDMVIGNDYYSSYRGGAYIFDGSGGTGSWGSNTLDRAADRIISGVGTSDYFGNRVHFIPDLDGDGYDELAVRAMYEYTLYLFDGDEVLPAGISGNTTASSANASIRDISTGAYYWGWSVDAGDMDGDGDNDLMSTNYNGTGAVFLFENGGRGLSGTYTTLDATASIAGNSDGFGYGAAVSDTDSDGRAEVMVGAYNYSEVAPGAGAVFVFDADNIASLDGSTHYDYGRPVIADSQYDYWGYSVVAGEDWWAAGSYGSSSYNNGMVYLVDHE